MSRHRVSPATLPAGERQSRSRLHQLLAQAEGFLHGSLIVMARRCGKPTCRCATDEQAKHRSLYLGQTLNGKTSMLYIPCRMERQVHQWVANFQRAAQLLEELSQQGRNRFKQTKQQTAAGKTSPRRAPAKAAKPKPPRTPS
jgi:hypothetical protein